MMQTGYKMVQKTQRYWSKIMLCVNPFAFSSELPRALNWVPFIDCPIMVFLAGITRSWMFTRNVDIFKSLPFLICWVLEVPLCISFINAAITGLLNTALREKQAQCRPFFFLLVVPHHLLPNLGEQSCRTLAGESPVAKSQHPLQAAWQQVDQQWFASASLPPSPSSCATGLRSIWQESQLW